MKKFTVILFILFLNLNPAFAQNTSSPTEFTGSFIYLMPGQDDDYDSGVGAEVQFRFWPKKNIGLALAVGIQNWEANEDWRYYGTSWDEAVRITGDIQMVPIGVSILFRPALNDKLCLTFEGGVRYVLVNEDLEFEDKQYWSSALRVDNGVIGLLAMNVEAELAERISFLGGIGYQFDISKGDAETFWRKTGENELKAFVVRTGVAIKF